MTVENTSEINNSSASKIAVAVILLIVLLIVGGFYLLSPQVSKNGVNKTPKTVPAREEVKSPSPSVGSGRYIEYKSGVLETATDTMRVLFFYANWCPTCRPADADFKANSSKIPADTTLIRVNYNDNETDAEEKALASKYGVTYQHTYVLLDSQGEVLVTWNGGQTEKLLEMLK